MTQVNQSKGDKITQLAVFNKDDTNSPAMISLLGSPTCPPFSSASQPSPRSKHTSSAPPSPLSSAQLPLPHFLPLPCLPTDWAVHRALRFTHALPLSGSLADRPAESPPRVAGTPRAVFPPPPPRPAPLPRPTRRLWPRDPSRPFCVGCGWWYWWLRCREREGGRRYWTKSRE